MKNDDLQYKLLNWQAQNLLRYAVERELSPDEFSDLFHEGIARVAEQYPEDHPLRIKVMIGSYSEAEMPNVKLTGSALLRSPG